MEATKTIIFDIQIDFTICPPVFTFVQADNAICDGSCTTTLGIPEQITYRLPNKGFKMLDPVVMNNAEGVISYTINEDNQALTIENAATQLCDVGIQIIIQDKKTKLKYASPDPRVRVKPENT